MRMKLKSTAELSKLYPNHEDLAKLMHQQGYRNAKIKSTIDKILEYRARAYPKLDKSIVKNARKAEVNKELASRMK